MLWRKGRKKGRQNGEAVSADDEAIQQMCQDCDGADLCVDEGDVMVKGAFRKGEEWHWKRKAMTLFRPRFALIKMLPMRWLRLWDTLLRHKSTIVREGV